MEKLATAEAPIHDLLRRRWSPRAFSSDAVEDGVLRSLFEAARWAPSSANEQPWRFVIARRDNRDDFERLVACLTGSNPRWAAHAPVLVLTVASTTWHRNGAPNRHAWHDTGLALANLMVEATARGLVTHAMAGFDAAKARETFAIPADFDPIAVVAVGYPGDPATLPEDLQERERAPRHRRPLPETVFAGTWGKPAPL